MCACGKKITAGYSLWVVAAVVILLVLGECGGVGATNTTHMAKSEFTLYGMFTQYMDSTTSFLNFDTRTWCNTTGFTGNTANANNYPMPPAYYKEASEGPLHAVLAGMDGARDTVLVDLNLDSCTYTATKVPSELYSLVGFVAAPKKDMWGYAYASPLTIYRVKAGPTGGPSLEGMEKVYVSPEYAPNIYPVYNPGADALLIVLRFGTGLSSILSVSTTSAWFRPLPDPSQQADGTSVGVHAWDSNMKSMITVETEYSIRTNGPITASLVAIDVGSPADNNTVVHPRVVHPLPVEWASLRAAGAAVDPVSNRYVYCGALPGTWDEGVISLGLGKSGPNPTIAYTVPGSPYTVVLAPVPSNLARPAQ